MAPLFIVWEGWIRRGKIQILSVRIRCLFLVTRKVWLGFFLWHLLNLHLHLIFMSHGRCDLSLYIDTPYIYIYTFLLWSTKKLIKRNYKKRHPLMLISQSLGLAPSNPLRHEGCWAHGLGLGLRHRGPTHVRAPRSEHPTLCPVHMY